MRPVTFGIEEEFFIIEDDRTTRGLAQGAFLKDFASRYGFRIASTLNTTNAPSQINRDEDSGYTSIKFDSTINILEVAYPPFLDPESAIQFYSKTWNQLTETARSHSLSLIRKGYRNFNLTDADFLKKDSVQKTLNRRHTNKPHFDRHYPGKICSTQIHLNLDKNSTFNKLESYYLFEPLIPILFSNSQVPNIAHCYRLLTLQDSFHDDYIFFGFPDQVFRSRSQYELCRSRTSGCWRDYSLIVPRDFGTWEFRSACIQPSLSALETLLHYRLAVAKLLSTQNTIKSEVTMQALKITYIQACKDVEHHAVRNYFKVMVESGALEQLIGCTTLVKLKDLLIDAASGINGTAA
jgi:hypothetical protein